MPIILVILVVLFIFWFTIKNKEKIEYNKEDIVKQYIKNNISELSPEEAALGGFFYITNIDFIDDKLVIVDYEDGHIALKAKVKYSIKDNNVIIQDFELID